jgi:hypothetical protein
MGFWYPCSISGLNHRNVRNENTPASCSLDVVRLKVFGHRGCSSVSVIDIRMLISLRDTRLPDVPFPFFDKHDPKLIAFRKIWKSNVAIREKKLELSPIRQVAYNYEHIFTSRVNIVFFRVVTRPFKVKLQIGDTFLKRHTMSCSQE